MRLIHVHAKDGGDIYINPQYIDVVWTDAEGGVHLSTVGSPDSSIAISESLKAFDQVLTAYNKLENWKVTAK